MSTAVIDNLELDRIAKRLRAAVARKNGDFAKRAADIGEQLAAAKKEHGRGRTGQYERWVRSVVGWSRMHALRWVNAAEIVTYVLQNDLAPPANEKQAAAIAAIDLPHRMTVWRECIDAADGNMDSITAAKITARGEPYRKDKKPTEFSSIIKPSDNWNFSPVYYGRIDEDSHGYIPGEIYANCFWYYVENGWDVCDLMAGSGQALRVYEDRKHWGRGRIIDFNLRLFDLTPRGRYANRIEQIDARHGLPEGYRPQYIFMDVPYLGMVAHAYSESAHDLANMTPDGFLSGLEMIAKSCAKSQDAGSLCTVMAPATVDWNRRQRVIVQQHVRFVFQDAGYRVFDVAYATRRIQQNPSIAADNNRAKKASVMLSDIAEIQTFRREATDGR
jgi:ParB family chromosome partitioning protein